jgi:hypothetical protein
MGGGHLENDFGALTITNSTLSNNPVSGPRFCRAVVGGIHVHCGRIIAGEQHACRGNTAVGRAATPTAAAESSTTPVSSI